MLIQQNVDGSNSFNRSWNEFKVGFNDSRGNYWLGNELLHQMTSSESYKLRFDLQAINDSWYYAEYSSFVVLSEASQYMLQVSGYSGNAGDALSYSNECGFTTYDRVNDASGNNCAADRGGGFWYSSCVYCGVNVARGRPDDFKWRGLVDGYYGDTNFDLQTTRMWLTC